jgi:transcriptional regulator with XRE-family HTH domain
MFNEMVDGLKSTGQDEEVPVRRNQTGVYMELSSPNALRAWMEYKGLRQRDDDRPGAGAAELADLVGCSRQFIYMLLTGAKKTVRPDTARRIEQVLLPPVEHRSPTEIPLFMERSSKPLGGKSGTVRGRRKTAA